jgi:hypothetical protein
MIVIGRIDGPNIVFDIEVVRIMRVHSLRSCMDVHEPVASTGGGGMSECQHREVAE